MKRFVTLAFATGLLFTPALMACQVQGDSNQKAQKTEEQTAVGGYVVATNEVASQLTSEQTESFAKAMEGYAGLNLTPVAALGIQVVAGQNTAYLCQGTTVTAEPKTDWYVVVVYQDLEDNSSITSANKIDISDVKMTDKVESGLAGGWDLVPNTSSAVALPEEALNAWARASVMSEIKTLTPVAVLGTQVVAGTNYLVLASSTDAEGTTMLYSIVLYADLEGGGTFINESLFDLLAYV